MSRLAALAFLLAAAVAAVPAAADQTDARLGAMFEALHEAPDVASAQPIEAGIWRIWFEHADTKVRALMESGVSAMNGGDAAAALSAFDEAIAIAPGYAEAWNRRATLNYMMGRLDESLADIAKTLELEPRHFGALSGRGLVYVRLEKWNLALESFEAALKVHPNMPGPRANADAIRQTLRLQDI